MINCRKCDFFIKGSMRHALMNNCCPACGSAILGETYTQRMRLFKQKLLQQEFAQKLHDDLVFDITLFMLLEFSPVGPEEGGLQDPSDQPDQLDEQDEKEDYEKIRDEIRKEVLSEGGDSLEDLDEDLKVARLKRLAKESKVGRPGTSVRRLGSD
tara:strand:- start:510 stop:974 length:465 start_codon:yes stop_codon:yes gene_type:complete